MKKGNFLFAIGFFISSTLAFGQDYAFRVLANKGSNEVKTGDSWQAIKTGTSLKISDELKISENSYLALVYKTGKPLEVKKAGSYKVSDLANSIGPGQSVLNQYVDFVLSSNSAEAKKNRMSATGAVHRGEPVAINLLLPLNDNAENARVYNNNVMITWESSVPGPYVVVLKDMFEEEKMKVETPENKVEINFADPKFGSETAILVEIKSKSDPTSHSETKLIKKLSADENAKVKKSLDQVMAQMNDENAINEYILAGFYEDNKLYIDAIGSYEKAIKLAPDVPEYKEAYEEFLFRTKIKTPNPK